MRIKEKRLEELSGYGFKTLGETVDNETIVAKMYETGVVLVMAVHENYTSQVRFSKEHFEALKELEPEKKK